MEKLQVKGHSNLFRDTSSNAILNTDMNAYQNYMESKKIKEEESKRMSDIESDLNSLKSDMNEIKTMLRSLVNGS
jgi:DNA-binding ferritin-like protein